jgi:hypothetical protein
MEDEVSRKSGLAASGYLRLRQPAYSCRKETMQDQQSPTMPQNHKVVILTTKSGVGIESNK